MKKNILRFFPISLLLFDKDIMHVVCSLIPSEFELVPSMVVQGLCEGLLVMLPKVEMEVNLTRIMGSTCISI